MDKFQRFIAYTLFVSFWAVYFLGAIGTLGMLFFGIGSVHDSERGVLLNAFLVETAIAIGTLFYSVFRLRKAHEEVDTSALKTHVEQLEAEVRRKEELIGDLRRQSEVENPPPRTYRDAVVALCSPNDDTEVSDILKGLLLDAATDRDRVNEVLDEIGRMKRSGELYTQSTLRPHSVRLKS